MRYIHWQHSSYKSQEDASDRDLFVSCFVMCLISLWRLHKSITVAPPKKQHIKSKTYHLSCIIYLAFPPLGLEVFLFIAPGLGNGNHVLRFRKGYEASDTILLRKKIQQCIKSAYVVRHKSTYTIFFLWLDLVNSKTLSEIKLVFP